MNAWIHTAGWLLVHFVWQGAVLALIAAVALHSCRHRSPSVRYAIACVALAAMLVGILITGTVIDAPAHGLTTAPTTSMRGTSGGLNDVLLPIDISGSSPSAVTSAAQRVETMLPWIVSLWLTGVVFLLARSASGWWRVRRLHGRALSSTMSDWQLAASRVALRIGLTRAFRVVDLPDIDVPLVIGCLRPIVVLPIAAMAQLHASQVEAILAHELAHIRRHDYLVNLIQTLAETLLFYHPAVWWLSNRVREEREHCCDDVAMAVCGDPVGYVTALTELEMGRHGEVALAPGATGGSLLGRARRVLGVDISHTANGRQWIVPLVLVAATVATVTALAQTRETAPTEKFEVASVRPNTSGEQRASTQNRPDGFTAINVRVVNLIINAYGVQASQLIGAPAWISSERFDIVANAGGAIGPPVAPDAPSPRQLMMRALLADRFRLRVRRETRELPVYALVLARSDGSFGPELKRSTIDCERLTRSRAAGPVTFNTGDRPQCGARVLSGQFVAGGRPLSELVSMLSSNVGRSVVDRTGLEGIFDMSLKWAPDDQPGRVNEPDSDSDAPSIFTALQEQSGLKLESARGPVEVLVIDHIERPVPD
jgi:uncharacterized protein (TIGR03435 family)